jgi:pyruvate dehydrogenase E1 component beta subunit
VRKTHRCVVVQEGWPFAGVGAEIVALVAHEAFDELDAPPARVTNLDVPMPYARNVEEVVLPSPARVIAAVRGVLGLEQKAGTPAPAPRARRAR